jgi:hypothetical protein
VIRGNARIRLMLAKWILGASSTVLLACGQTEQSSSGGSGEIGGNNADSASSTTGGTPSTGGTSSTTAAGETNGSSSGGMGTAVDAGPDGASCDSDGECESHFCDLRRCTEPDITWEDGVETGYGAVCDDEYVFPGGAIPLPWQAPCVGGYICKQDRCRSCTSSNECGTESPSGCYFKPDHPGQSCGNMPLDFGWTLVDEGPTGAAGAASD